MPRQHDTHRVVIPITQQGLVATLKNVAHTLRRYGPEIIRRKKARLSDPCPLILSATGPPGYRQNAA